MDDNIKYIFIGNLVNKKEITDYPVNVNKDIANDGKSIFDKLANQKSHKYDERFKVESRFGIFHFTIFPTNTFYLVVADKYFPPRNVFEMINELHEKMIYLLVNEKGEISNSGKKKFLEIVEKKKGGQNKALENAQVAIDDVKLEMQNNIKKVMSNMEDVEELDRKAKNIEVGAEMMKDNAKKLKCCAFLGNLKWTIIIVTVIVAALIIIIVPIAVHFTEEDKKNAQQQNIIINNNSTIIPNPSPSPPKLFNF